MLGSVISYIASVMTIISFSLGYWHYISKGSLSAVRRKVGEWPEYLNERNISTDIIFCLGRGGFFIGSLLSDILDRKVPLLGIDKAYYPNGSEQKTRFPRIEIPKEIVLPDEYLPSPSIILVTGEIVDGASMKKAVEFIKSNIPDSVITTFCVYWSYDSCFAPDCHGFKINGRQRRVPWKRKISPSASDYPHSRKVL